MLDRPVGMVLMTYFSLSRNLGRQRNTRRRWLGRRSPSQKWRNTISIEAITLTSVSINIASLNASVVNSLAIRLLRWRRRRGGSKTGSR